MCGNPVCTNALSAEQSTFCSLKCLRDTKNLKTRMGKEYHVKVWRAREEYLDDWQLRFDQAIRDAYQNTY